MPHDHDYAIERLLALFGEPRTSNPEMFIDEFRKAVAGVTAERLHAAIDKGVHKWVFFPKPAEIFEILYPPVTYTGTPQNFKDYPEPPPRTEEQKARNRALLAECLANLEAAGRMRVTDNRRRLGDTSVNVVPDVSRPAFEKMQRDSRNTHLQRDYRQLPPSRKMMAAGRDE